MDIIQIISLFILGPVFLPVFSYCPFKLPYLYCFICPVRCVWYKTRGLALVLALALNIKRANFCKRICPFGSIQVALFKLCPKKITFPAFLEKARFAGLLLLLLVITMTRFPQTFYVRLAGLSLSQVFVTTLKKLLYGTLILSMVLSIFSYRAFCRYLCPTGALSKIMDLLFFKMNAKAVLRVLIAGLLFFFASGCQGKNAARAPSPKLISLAPSITEILFALGLEKHIVGITNACDYPAATAQIEQVATFSNQANLERILMLQPDFIFSTGLEQAPLVEKLKRLGFYVVLIYPKNLDELMSGILQVGKLTDKQQQAQALVSSMKNKIENIRQKSKRIPEEQKPKVFVEISPDPLMTAGEDSFIDELITLAGGKNIARDCKRPYSQFSPELVARRNPDYIILGYMQSENNSQLISQRMGWQDINAIKNNRIITDIDPDLFLRPGPRIVQGLEQIHSRLCTFKKTDPNQ